MGEILIRKLVVLENFSFVASKQMMSIVESYNVSTTKGLNLISDEQDTVTRTVQKYSRPVVEDLATDLFIDIKSSLISNTFGGISWISKISGCIPKHKINNNYQQLEENSLAICAWNKILPCKKIWLDYCLPSQLSEINLNTIKKAQKIFTPSIEMYNYFNSHGIEQVFLLSKPLFYITPQEIPYFRQFKYHFLINRNIEISNQIIKNWDQQNGKLVILGARGQFPDYVIPVHEYLSYNQLLFILENAQSVLDFYQGSNNYLSSWQELTMDLGKPVFSNNWSILSSQYGHYLHNISLINKKISNLPYVPMQSQNINTKFSNKMKQLFND